MTAGTVFQDTRGPTVTLSKLNPMYRIEDGSLERSLQQAGLLPTKRNAVATPFDVGVVNLAAGCTPTSPT